MLFPKQDIELLDFYIETHLDYNTSKGVFCNGFQSWTESRMYSKEEKLKAQRRGVKVIGEAYGDGMLYEYKNKKYIFYISNKLILFSIVDAIYQVKRSKLIFIII